MSQKKQNLRDEVLVVDDEPHNVNWIIDYLDSIGYSVRTVTNLNDAVRELGDRRYHAVVIDLNIPALEPLDLELRKEDGVYGRFPGLYAARCARNFGYTGRQTIIYSVHQDREVFEISERMGCTYLLKGRPKAFKDELDDVLARVRTKRRKL